MTPQTIASMTAENTPEPVDARLLATAPGVMVPVATDPGAAVVPEFSNVMEMLRATERVNSSDWLVSTVSVKFRTSCSCS